MVMMMMMIRFEAVGCGRSEGTHRPEWIGGLRARSRPHQVVRDVGKQRGLHQLRLQRGRLRLRGGDRRKHSTARARGERALCAAVLGRRRHRRRRPARRGPRARAPTANPGFLSLCASRRARARVCASAGCEMRKKANPSRVCVEVELSSAFLRLKRARSCSRVVQRERSRLGLLVRLADKVVGPSEAFFFLLRKFETEPAGAFFVFFSCAHKYQVGDALLAKRATVHRKVSLAMSRVPLARRRSQSTGRATPPGRFPRRIGKARRATDAAWARARSLTRGTGRAYRVKPPARDDLSLLRTRAFAE